MIPGTPTENAAVAMPVSRDGVMKWTIVAGLVAVLTAILARCGLTASLDHGRLAVPPTYDDVVYIVEAMRWIAAAPSRNWVADIHAILVTHSPITTVFTVLGLLAFPASYVGPYAANAVVVAGFLAGIAVLVRKLKTIEIVVCLVAVASVPTLVQVFNEARPDLPWGLVLGLAVAANVSNSPLDHSSRAAFGLGLLSGVAIIAKPSAIPASLLLIFSSALIAAGAALMLEAAASRKARLMLLLPRMALFILGIALFLGPLLAVGYDRIFGYIWQTLVTNKDLWAYPGGFEAQARFYWDIASAIALGRWLWIGLGLFAVRIALAAVVDKTDLRHAIVLLATVLLAYAIPSASVMKSFFVGAMFYGAFIVAMALNFAAIATLLPRAVTALNVPQIAHFEQVRRVSLLSVALLLGIFGVARSPLLATRFSPAEVRDLRMSADQLWAVLRPMAVSLNKTGKTPRIAFSSPHPVNPQIIELKAMRDSLKVVASGLFFSSDIAVTLKSLKRADLAAVSSSRPHNLPGPRMGDDLIRALDDDPQMCAVATIPLLDVSLHLYRNRDETCTAGSASR